MRRSEGPLRDPAPEAEWELWYRDTFDMECPPSVDVSGRGLAKGLMELATSLGVALDESMRFIQADKAQRTNIPGIFAAGDICGPPWQVAKAVGEGCVAGLNAADYAKKAAA